MANDRVTMSWKLARVSCANVAPSLPNGSFALFRSVPRVKRGDVVLVDHPVLGRIVKKVNAVGMNGGVWLNGLSKHCDNGQPVCGLQPGRVDPEHVFGKLALGLPWLRFLPRLGSKEEPQATSAGPDDTQLT